MSDKEKQVAVRQQGSVVASNNTVKQRPKKKSLEEEDFTEAMKEIIRRDFFPDVQKLEAQLAFIEATETNDTEKLREISERFATDHNIKTPSVNATPSTMETPSSSIWGDRKRVSDPPDGNSNEEIDTKAKKMKPEESKSLDEFLRKYHSEDDASFDDIMEREEARRREKYAWMYEREALAENMNRPAITSGDKEIHSLESSGEQLAVTDGEEGRRGDIAMWNYTAKNSLMYIPDGVELSGEEMIEKGKEKEIKHSNTRLSRDFLKKMAAVNSNDDTIGVVTQTKRDKVGIDGKQLGVDESPNIHGYGFVATPQIHPGVDASPLMTWGTIEGTPLHIDVDITATPGPVFKIPKAPKRDQLALKLAGKVSKNKREKKKAAMAQATYTLLGKSPSLRGTPGSTSERLQMLSPAARKLIRQSTSPGTIRGVDKALRASYTPTHSSSSTPKHSSSERTPKYGNQSPKYGNRTPSLTDNLLNL